MDEHIGVSVIIPALNEEKVIGLCLDSLVKLDFPRLAFEVILVDNGSTDRTLEVAQSFSTVLNLILLQKKGVHISSLRNLGASKARGEIFAFLDSDCLVSPAWLTRAIVLFKRENVGVVGAHYRIPENSGWVARAWFGGMESEKQGDLPWVPSGDLMVTRATFERIGGFDASIETNEDCEFCERVCSAGLRVVGDPAVAVVHLGTPDDLLSFYRKVSWHATSGLRVYRRDPWSLLNARPVLFGFYTLVCLAGAGIGVILVARQKGLDVLAVSLAALALPSFLLSLRLVFKRRKWADLFPLMLLNLVYGLARGRSLLIVKNWNGTGDGRRAASNPANTYAI